MIIYTDGSAQNNGKTNSSGGFGVVVLDNNENLIYNYSKRDGCALCYNAKPIERKIWLDDYPKAYDILLELQNKLKPLLVGRKNEYPLRKYHHFIEIPPLLERAGVIK